MFKHFITLSDHIVISAHGGQPLSIIYKIVTCAVFNIYQLNNFLQSTRFGKSVSGWTAVEYSCQLYGYIQ